MKVLWLLVGWFILFAVSWPLALLMRFHRTKAHGAARCQCRHADMQNGTLRCRFAKRLQAKLACSPRFI